MKKIAGITGLCLALTAILAFWGCEKDATENDGDYAYVRFIHSAASFPVPTFPLQKPPYPYL